MKQPQGNHFLVQILATNNLQVTTSWLIYVFYPIWITASMARKKIFAGNNFSVQLKR
jgi:type IV secretory pathway VirB9-like protein